MMPPPPPPSATDHVRALTASLVILETTIPELSRLPKSHRLQALETLERLEAAIGLACDALEAAMGPAEDGDGPSADMPSAPAAH